MKRLNENRVRRAFHLLLGMALLTVAVPVLSRAQAPAPPPSTPNSLTAGADAELAGDRARVIHMLQRATFGVRPADIEEAMELGVEGWIDRQLEPRAITDTKVERLIDERFVAATMGASELLELYPPNQVVRALRSVAQDSVASDAERDEARQMLRQRNPGRIVQDLTGARLTRAAHSERQLEEMMTEFWFDHFNVDFRKNQLRWLVADYESSAIRPNVFGSFSDLLLATAMHPAMLLYLDNAQSVAPQPNRRQPIQGLRGRQELRAGQPMRPGLRDVARRRTAERQRPRASERGLNENYARELLELHTLGVDGGYTQADVLEVARAFTGWGISRPPFRRGDLQRMSGSAPASVDAVVQLLDNASYDGALEFLFRKQMHDPGDKVVLGDQFPGSSGMDDALAVLEMLATHPSTTRHVATQLVTRFVSDDPSQQMVDQLASVFVETDGDLAAVTRALFTSPGFYSPEARGSKVKSPFLLIASAVRATETEVVNVRALGEVLTSLGERPYLAEAPTGYPETSSGWVSGGAMINRMDFAESFAAGEIRGLRFEVGSGLLRGVDPAKDGVELLADRLLPGEGTQMVAGAVRDVIEGEGSLASPRDQVTRALGLLIGSPAFQRH